MRGAACGAHEHPPRGRKRCPYALLKPWPRRENGFPNLKSSPATRECDTPAAAEYSNLQWGGVSTQGTLTAEGIPRNLSCAPRGAFVTPERKKNINKMGHQTSSQGDALRAPLGTRPSWPLGGGCGWACLWGSQPNIGRRARAVPVLPRGGSCGVPWGGDTHHP